MGASPVPARSCALIRNGLTATPDRDEVDFDLEAGRCELQTSTRVGRKSQAKNSRRASRPLRAGEYPWLDLDPDYIVHLGACLFDQASAGRSFACSYSPTLLISSTSARGQPRDMDVIADNQAIRPGPSGGRTCGLMMLFFMDRYSLVDLTLS